MCIKYGISSSELLIFKKKTITTFFLFCKNILFCSYHCCIVSVLKFILSIIMVKKGYLRDFEGGIVVGVRQLL